MKGLGNFCIKGCDILYLIELRFVLVYHLLTRNISYLVIFRITHTILFNNNIENGRPIPHMKTILLHTINIESSLPDGLFHIKFNGKTFTNWVFSEDHTEFCQPKIVCWQTFFLSYSIRSHKNNIYRSNKLVLSSCFEKQSQLYYPWIIFWRNLY